MKDSVTPKFTDTFKTFILGNKDYRLVLLIASAAIITQFVIFKYFYPNPSFIHGDSFVYLQTAFWNLDVNNYMVGYSRFLRLFSVFTRLDIALVAFQYLLLQFSSFLFLFTLFYFYKPIKGVQLILFTSMTFNPLFLYLANMVSSDPYFLALSFIWFTILLWLIHKPSMRLILIHAFVIYIAFTVRNNAMIYPLIAILALSLSSLKMRQRIQGIVIFLIPITLFVIYTSHKFQKLTGHWQYSPFSGWQLANNAMYAYRFVDSTELKPVPSALNKLDKMVRTYFDTSRDLIKHPHEILLASTVYMWDGRSPLQIYMHQKFLHDTISSERKQWAAVGPIYSNYGLFLIKSYPKKFAKYFLWPNTLKYFSPPVEFLEAYNMGTDTVAPIVKEWFGYKSLKLNTRVKDLQKSTLNFYPTLSGIVNTLFVGALVCFFLLNGLSRKTRFRQGILLAIAFWIVNAGFTIFASSAALRFQAFPILMLFSFNWLLLSFIIQHSTENKDIIQQNLVPTVT